VVFNTEPYTVLPDNSILNTANMQWETGFPSRLSGQLKSCRTKCTKLNQLMELVAAAKLLQLKKFVVVTEDLVGDFLTKFYSCRK